MTTDSRPVAGVSGCGATGARAARVLADAGRWSSIVLAGDHVRVPSVVDTLGPVARAGDPLAEGAGVVVLAGPCGTHVEAARSLVHAGTHVVSTSDSIDDVEGLLALDRAAVENNVRLVIGAAFAPGLSGVLARHASGWMDDVDEIHVARFGTGGPSCARQHHSALSSRSIDWKDDEFVRRPGGSGRELCAFPDPVGSVDCYRAGLPDALLLAPAFPGVSRVTARQAADRRTRLTSWLPMLRKPHPEGELGAIRVEVRGRVGTACVTEVLGAIDRPAVAAGAVAGLAACWALDGRLGPPGAAGLAASLDSVEFLRALATAGVRAAAFTGSS